MTLCQGIGIWWSKKYLAKNSMMTLEYLPYSLDLSLPDFLLLPRIQSVLKGQQFASAKAIIAK
jgi:hypothetical protein